MLDQLKTDGFRPLEGETLAVLFSNSSLLQAISAALSAPLPWQAASSEWTDTDCFRKLPSRVETLKSLKNFVTKDRPEYHSTDRPKETAVDTVSGRRFTLRSQERSEFSLTTLVFFSKATLGRLFRDGMLMRASMPFLDENETELGKARTPSKKAG